MNIAGLIAGLALPAVWGYLLIHWAFRGAGGLLLKLSLGVGVGAGLASCLFFLGLLAGLPFGVTIAVEVAVAAFLIWRRPVQAAETSASVPFWLAGVAIVSAALVTVAIAMLSVQAPHGNWDAWSIWNLRARYLFRAGPDWRIAFSPLLSEHHLDYPLLIPGLVARLWEFMGEDSTAAPSAVAALFGLGTLGVLAGTVSALRGRASGAVAALVLLATPFFWKQTAAQYADVPLAFFLLTSIALIALSDGQSRLLALAGASAGLAAWTKNEGVAMAAALAAGVAFAAARERRSYGILAFTTGLVPVALLVAIFKLTIAPPSYLANARWAQLADPSRYAAIAAGFGAELVRFGETPLNPLVLLTVVFFLVGRDRSQPMTAGLIAIVLTLAADAAALLVTPFDLKWQMDNSANRLLLQVWPAAILVGMLAVRSVVTGPPTVARSRTEAKSNRGR